MLHIHTGDKYGEPLLPLEMRQDEFQKIQSAAFEQGTNGVMGSSH